MSSYSKSFAGDDIILLMCLVNNCISDNEDLKVKNIDIQENIINSEVVERYVITVYFV